MEAAQQPPQGELPPELVPVAEAAGNRLRAEVDGDEQAAQAGAQFLLEAATSAMNAGYSLTEITQAETRGKLDVREALRPDTLKHVERTGRIVREAQTEHHRTIVRAVRLGLSTRQIAAAAGVTHGTVRAITNRLTGQSPPEEPGSESGDWAPDDQEHGGEERQSEWNE
jgi:hypothetical protein